MVRSDYDKGIVIQPCLPEVCKKTAYVVIRVSDTPVIECNEMAYVFIGNPRGIFFVIYRRKQGGGAGDKVSPVRKIMKEGVIGWGWIVGAVNVVTVNKEKKRLARKEGEKKSSLDDMIAYVAQGPDTATNSVVI